MTKIAVILFQHKDYWTKNEYTATDVHVCVI